MKTFTVKVYQIVEVTLDETKFDEAFMAEYQRSFSPIKDIEGHAQNLAWLHGTGRENIEYQNPVLAPFIEGYGPANEMGITAKTIDEDTEIEA